MRKIVLLLSFVLLAGLGAANAQRTITGTVTAKADNSALPGVTVQVKGATGIGTMTGTDGTYSIKVPEEYNVLVFSFVGMKKVEQQISGTVVNAALETADIAVDEVVVTALGVTREKKSLGYATQKIGGDQVSEVKNDNFVNTMSGKVAGVQIKQNGNFGGSTNIIIRGSTSLTGNNQALFVVDGVPMSNTNLNGSSQQQGGSGYDYGSPVADLNADDIESINILKGAAATALYGSRAANGVVIITTKKGTVKAGNPIGVTVSSSYGIGMVDKSTFPTYQNEYGAGYGPYYSGGDHPGLYNYADLNGDGVNDLLVPTTEDASFGEKFDPSLMVFQWDAFVPESSNYGKATPWVAAENGAITFFNTAKTYKNSVAVEGANENASFRLAYTNLDQSGIFPNSKLNRNNVNFNASYKPIENLTVSANANYINSETTGRNSTGYSNNILSSFRQWWEVNVDVQELKDLYFQTKRNVTWNMNYPDGGDVTPIYWDNYYWDRYENVQSDGRDRILGNFAVDYKINDNFGITGRASVDYYSTIQEERLAVGSIARRFGIGRPEVGSGYTRKNYTFRENNYDLMANYNQNFGDVSLTALIGGNIRRDYTQSIFASTNGGLVVPDLYAVSNSMNSVLSPEESQSLVAVNGIYGRASVGYKDFLYLEGTIRNDVSSTLPEGNNSYFYPSIAANVVFSNLIDASWLQFGKVRFNYAEVGNSAPFASVSDVYSKPSPFGSTTLFSVSGTKNNDKLEPERTKSLEAGIEMMFLNKRLGVDFSYYKTNTIQQILPVSVSRASGYSYKYVNSGNIENSGIELALTGTPVKMNDLRWDITLNWSQNKNKVVDLFKSADGTEVTNVVLGSFQGGITINATKGEPYGTIKGTDFTYSDNGEKVIKTNGFYQKTTTSDNTIGDVNPDWNGGLRNSITYKGLNLNFLLDMQYGGDIFSLDQWYGQGTGIYPESVGTNDLGNPVRNSISDGGGFVLDGVQADGSTNTVRVPGDRYSAYGWARYPNAAYVYDASYLKLREVNLSYTLPKGTLGKFFQGATIGVTGYNVAILWKNLPYADPEAGLSSGNLQGFQSGVMPTTRNFSVNLKLKF